MKESLGIKNYLRIRWIFKNKLEVWIFLGKKSYKNGKDRNK